MTVQVHFDADGPAREAARYKTLYRREKLRRQKAEAKNVEQEGLISGLRNQNEWLREQTGYRDNWI